MAVPLSLARIVALAAVCAGACAANTSALGAHSSRHRGSRHARAAPHHASRAAPHHARAAPHRGCRDAELMPTSADLKLIRAATLCLVNRERAHHGERPLRPNARLRLAAQAHSASMARTDYFEHVGPRGQTPLARMLAVGYISSRRVGFEVGENIAWGTLGLATPRAIVASWMASAGHRANILDQRYRETGIGISPHPLSSRARGQAGAIYTQDFGVVIRR